MTAQLYRITVRYTGCNLSQHGDKVTAIVPAYQYESAGKQCVSTIPKTTEQRARAARLSQR